MSENYENSSGDLVHVDAYTRDDGTHVSEYWRSRPGNGGTSSGGFSDKKRSNNIPNGDFAPSDPLGRIDTPYNYQLGGIVPPYLQSTGGIVESNPIDVNESYKPLLSYLSTDNSGQNENNFVLTGGVSWDISDEMKRNNIFDFDKIYTDIQNKIDNVKQVSDNFWVSIANKPLTDITGKMFSHFLHTQEAYEFYKMASPDYDLNSEYVKNNGVLHESTNQLGNDKLASRIKARLYLENTGMKDCKVFETNTDSSISQKIVQSDELQNEIKKNIDYIRNYNTFPTKFIEFSSPDLYNSIHGGNIQDAHIDKEGNLNFSVEDLYNFNKGRTSVRGRVGEKLQNEGSLVPYYLKINVKIPKSELDKY